MGSSGRTGCNTAVPFRSGEEYCRGVKHSLDVMCSLYGIALDHHKADSDSHAAAEILLRYMEAGVDLEKWTRTFWLGGQ